VAVPPDISQPTQPTTHRKHLVIDIATLLLLLAAAIAALIFVLLPLFESKDSAVGVDATKKSPSNHTPALKTEVVLGGLDHPWDIAFLPDTARTMLLTERSAGISKVVKGQKTLLLHPSDIYAMGEGGTLGLTIDPQFVSNRFVYVCMNSTQGGPDVRVARFKVNQAITALDDRTDIITGIPSSKNGRHSGCRLSFGPDGNLWVGTGDAAQGSNPQNLKSLGGKILRVDRDGKAAKDNLGGDADPRIYSYGHRNIQGLAFYKTSKNGSYGISVEHGSTVDDEVNPLVKGNFGWAPNAAYTEQEPMTDLTRFPSAIKSIWSSGNPTIAPSDADFLVGEKWGAWQGRLAMGVLKDKHLRLLQLKDDNTTGEQLKLFDQEFGRIRAITMATDGSLYMTTDNGGNQDFVLRVTPEL
jgi:glucose/arabinose dehydrogenase